MRGVKSKLASLVGRPLLAAMVAAGAAAPGAALAAEDLWLKVFAERFGIVGEATTDGHQGEVVLLSYSQSFTNPASAAGRASRGSETNCGSVKVTKLVDRASPALIGAVALGRQYPEAVITFHKGDVDYYKVTLTDVLFDSIIQTDASPTEAIIMEQVSMSAAKFKFEYTPPPGSGSSGGTVTFGWDCKRNASF